MNVANREQQITNHMVIMKKTKKDATVESKLKVEES